MAVFGYIFLSEIESNVPLGQQQRLISQFASDLGVPLDEVVIEQGVSLRMPFCQRPEGEKMINGLEPGDSVIVVKSEWVFASAGEGARLLEILRKKAVSLFCIDLGENISTPNQRKLVVSEGSSEIVQKLLKALAVCETSRHGEAIKAVKRKRKKEGKYLGGPVPFGWRIDAEGHFEEDEEQQNIISEIRGLREDRWSYRDISLKLKENQGLNLSHEGIRRILENDMRRKEKLSRNGKQPQAPDD